jgi:hypothetical protein
MEEFCDGGACGGEFLKFSAGDEQIEWGRRVECSSESFGGILFAWQAEVEEDTFLGVDLFADFAEVFEADGEVFPEGVFVVQECGFGGSAEFLGEKDLVGVDVVVSAAAEELQLEVNSAEGEEVGDAERLVMGFDCRAIWCDKNRCWDGGVDGIEPFGALGAVIEDDVILFAEDVAPFVWEP